VRDSRTNDVDRSAREGCDGEGDVVLAGAVHEAVQAASVELLRIPVADARCARDKRVVCIAGRLALRKVSVQEIFRKLADSAKRLEPGKAGDRLYARRHGLRGLTVPENDVADEIGGRQRGNRQTQQLMAGCNPARMARVVGRNAVVQTEKR